MQDDKLHQVALTLVNGIGDVLVKNLISYVGNAEDVFRIPKSKLLKIPGIGNKAATEIQNSKVLKEAERQVKKSDESGVQLLFYTDKQYPDRLKQIYDSPALIYVKGNVDLNHQRMLAVVGSRKATGYGKSFIERMMSDLTELGVIVISGLAYGIDIAAHKAALAHNIPTIGVMASGVDIIYPSIHKKYADAMQESGGLVSEYPLGTKPDPARFPARNRIIAGLAHATLVVEAAEKGGALITADLASGYDREVFALPGDVNQSTSQGCNNLIKKNVAQLITSAADLSYYLQWEPNDTLNAQPLPTLVSDEFTREEWLVISTLQSNGKEMHIDELSWRSQTQISTLAKILLNLEFNGTIHSLPGKKYALR